MFWFWRTPVCLHRGCQDNMEQDTRTAAFSLITDHWSLIKEPLNQLKTNQSTHVKPKWSMTDPRAASVVCGLWLALAASVVSISRSANKVSGARGSPAGCTRRQETRWAAVSRRSVCSTSPSQLSPRDTPEHEILPGQNLSTGWTVRPVLVCPAASAWSTALWRQEGGEGPATDAGCPWCAWPEKKTRWQKKKGGKESESARVSLSLPTDWALIWDIKGYFRQVHINSNLAKRTRTLRTGLTKGTP